MRKVEGMTRIERLRNWEKVEVEIRKLTHEEWSKFKDEGGVIWMLIEELVAEGIDLKTWTPDEGCDDS